MHSSVKSKAEDMEVLEYDSGKDKNSIGQALASKEQIKGV